MPIPRMVAGAAEKWTHCAKAWEQSNEENRDKERVGITGSPKTGCALPPNGYESRGSWERALKRRERASVEL